jgi:acyl dehydratase
MPVVLGAVSGWMTDPEIGLNFTKLVHGDQSVRTYRPLRAGEPMRAIYKILSMSDKGAAKGAIIRAGCRFETLDGELVAESNNGFFFRGDGGFGGENLPSEPELPIPDRAADIVEETKVPLNAAIFYRLNGDMNKLHIDPDVAASVGFERPILHGSCTFGIATRVILDRVCDYRPGALKYVRTRFSAPVLPGETLRTEIWVDGGKVQYRTGVVERGIAVLTGGVAEIG